MVNNEEITANWAKNTTQANLHIKVEKELNDCLEVIKKAVSKNQTSTNVYTHVEQLTKRELEKRGFIVVQHSDQRDGDRLNINWE